MAVPKVTSVIWTSLMFESLPALFEAASSTPPLLGIGSEATYRQLFAQARALGSVSQTARTPTLPWPRSTGQGFWSTYFEGKDFTNVTESSAWRNLVPLRLGQPRIFLDGDADSRAHAEVFLYPHGLLSSTTLRLVFKSPKSGSPDILRSVLLSPAAFVDDSVAVGSFHQLGPALLEYTRKTAFGPIVQAGTRGAPFTICSVVRGDNIDSSVAVDDGGEIHRLIDGFATLDPSWRKNVLGAIAGRTLDAKGAPAGHVLYGRKNARVVWFPNHFTGASGQPHAINCYHRNLTMASGTVESLTGLASATVSRFAEGRTRDDLPLHWDALARRAAILLHRSGSA